MKAGSSARCLYAAALSIVCPSSKTLLLGRLECFLGTSLFLTKELELARGALFLPGLRLWRRKAGRARTEKQTEPAHRESQAGGIVGLVSSVQRTGFPLLLKPALSLCLLTSCPLLPCYCYFSPLFKMPLICNYGSPD